MRKIFPLILLLLLAVLCALASGQTTAEGWSDKGLALYDQGKYVEAIQAYDKAIEINPQLAGAWSNKGLALIHLGKYDEAIEALDRAIKIDPELAAAWFNKGLALYHQDKNNDAIQAYNRALEINPKYADVWHNKGLAFYNLAKYDEAIQAYDKVIELDPQNANAWNNKGNALHNQGMYSEAVQAYDKAIGINPQLALAWSNKGVALKRLGLISESNDAFDKAKELESEGSTGRHIAEPMTTGPKATETFIIENVMASKVDESTNNVITRTRKFSNNDNKAYSWLRLGNAGAGTVEWMWYSPDGNLYKTSSVDIPTPSGANWPFYNVWSNIDITEDMTSSMSGDWYVDVFLDGKKLFTESFSIVGYQKPYGQTAVSNENFAKAKELEPGGPTGKPTAETTTLREGQATASDWVNQGIALYEQGRYNEAVQAYNKAIEIDPQNVIAWSNKGNALKHQQKYDEAIQAFDKVLEINPNDADAWYYKGEVLDAQHKYDEAIQAFDKVLEINPNDADAWYYKGEVLGTLGKKDEANRSYDKAIEIDPQIEDEWWGW